MAPTMRQQTVLDATAKQLVVTTTNSNYQKLRSVVILGRVAIMGVIIKTFRSLKKVTDFDLDDAKSRLLVLETGYRYVISPGAPPENRLVEAATSNFPLKAGFLVNDRNRFDLDWKNSVFTWRYRNRLTVARTFAIRSYHFIRMSPPNPFARASTTSGALRLSMQAAYSPWADTSNSTPTTNTTATPASTRTSK